MNYERFIKEGQHLKTLFKLTKLTKEERTSARKDLEHLFNRYIFYPISTWPPTIKEILEHNTIAEKNTFKLILFAYGNGISPNTFIEYLYRFILNIPSKKKKKRKKKKHTPNTPQPNNIRTRHTHKHHSPYEDLQHDYSPHIFSQVMDSQMHNKLLEKFLEDYMTSLSGIESNVDLLEPDLEED